MLTELTGEEFESSLPGVELHSPDRWEPAIRIEPEYVRLYLKDKATGFEEEKIVREKNVALMGRSAVQELLEREMDDFLKLSGITADRNMSASIRGEIAVSMEMVGIRDDGSALIELDGVIIERDRWEERLCGSELGV